MNAIVTTEANANDAVLNDLLADLGTDSVESIDKLLATDAAAGVPGAVALLDDLEGLDDSLLESIEKGDAGAIDMKGADVVIDPVDDIIAEAADSAATDPAPTVTPAKKGGKKGTKKGGKKATTVPAGYGSDSEESKDAAVEPQPEEPAAAAEPTAPVTAAPKPLRPTSITHKPGDLLVAKLGSDDAAALLIFDDRHDGEQIQAAHAEFVARLNITDTQNPNRIADKVGEKVLMLFTWLQKGGALNEVMRRTFTVLHRDGKITTGMKGNLHLELLAKPYSNGTASSQAAQMTVMLPLLQIAIKEKGQLVPNPHSTLLPMINAALGLK